MIDLRTVDRILDESAKTVGLLDGKNVEDHDSTTKKREDVANVTRELLRLADNLALASALVRNEYHVIKGAPDPLTEETP